MPVLHKHFKGLDLIEMVSIGIDKIQRNFEPLKRQIAAWQSDAMEDDRAKLILYAAFAEGRLADPGICCRSSTGTTSSRSTRRSNRGRSGACRTLSRLRSIRQFQTTAKLAAFLGSVDGARSIR